MMRYNLYRFILPLFMCVLFGFSIFINFIDVPNVEAATYKFKGELDALIYFYTDGTYEAKWIGMECYEGDPCMEEALFYCLSYQGTMWTTDIDTFVQEANGLNKSPIGTDGTLYTEYSSYFECESDIDFLDYHSTMADRAKYRKQNQEGPIELPKCEVSMRDFDQVARNEYPMIVVTVNVSDSEGNMYNETFYGFEYEALLPADDPFYYHNIALHAYNDVEIFCGHIGSYDFETQILELRFVSDEEDTELDYTEVGDNIAYDPVTHTLTGTFRQRTNK